MRNKIFENRILKIWFIVLCVVAGYVIFHNVTDEVYFQRYSNRFVGFIEMYLNDHISLDYFISAPLFNSSIKIDPSLSGLAQSAASAGVFTPNFTILFLMLHYITGLSPQSLLILPLGVLFIPITYFAMIRTYVPIKDRSDFVFHVLLGIYITIHLATTKMYGSFYVAPPAFLLVVIIFLCMKKFYEKKSNRFYYIIICLSTISLTHYWHSTLMMTLVFIASLWIVSGVFYLFTKHKNIFSRTTSLFIISIIISLTFFHLWQTSYIGDFFRTADLIDFISKTLIKLGGGNPFPVPYAFSYKDLWWGKVHFISLLSIYILSTLILILSLIPHVFVSKNVRKGIEVRLALIFGLAIIFAQMINSFLYYKSSSIGFPSIPLFFPIFGVSSFIISETKNKLRKFIILSISLMIVLSLLSNIAIYITNEGGTTSVTKYNDTESSFEWLYHKMNRSKTVVADFNILGKYLQREAEKSKPSIEYEYISSNSYSVLVGDNEITEVLTKNYAIVDQATMSKGLPIHSYGSRALFEPKWIQIDNCRNQDKIYEDNYVSIFIFK